MSMSASVGTGLLGIGGGVLLGGGVACGFASAFFFNVASGFQSSANRTSNTALMGLAICPAVIGLALGAISVVGVGFGVATMTSVILSASNFPPTAVVVASLAAGFFAGLADMFCIDLGSRL